MQTEEWTASLKKLQLERHAYNHASACIYFDSATVTPRGSAEARSMALGILSEKSYHLFVNNETRNLLDELRSRRTELDELTLRQVELLSEELDDLTRIPVQEYVAYPLHVMVRYELEKQLVSGSLTVEDLPAAWNAPYKEYLDIDVPSDAMGVLQDMHWSDGSFGFFPTYALGSAYAAQLMSAMRKELDTDVLMEKGDLAPITAWLQSHVHRYGKLKNPADLLMQACGEAFDPQYYVDHLSTKVREIENA